MTRPLPPGVPRKAPGRKPGPPEDCATERIMVRLTPREMAHVEERAREEGVKVAVWCRTVLTREAG